jgi:uncharacterized damage-inducible protein DinB
MDGFLGDAQFEFRRHKELAEKAMGSLGDEEFFKKPAEAVNSIALVVKHLAGNLSSRWADFLTSDGEKPGRNRDGEFTLTDADSREELMAAWERGWETLLETLLNLNGEDLAKSVTIRGEKFTAMQAILRGLTHATYHVGQIMYVARLLRPDRPWLTMPPTGSKAWKGEYRKGGPASRS